MSCGGTLNAKCINNSLTHDTRINHLYFHGDSSQLSSKDLKHLIVFLEKAFQNGYSQFIIEFGTDTVCDLIDMIKETYSYLDKSKILCLTSMYSLADEADKVSKYKQDYFLGIDFGVIRLVVINRPDDHVFDLKKDSFRLSKIGEKSYPMVIRDNVYGLLLHLEEIKTVFPTAKWVFSGPSYDVSDIVDSLNEAVILCGVGDFNFNISSEILVKIEALKQSDVNIYLTTIFKGSFDKPDDVAYFPRKTLEELGVTLLSKRFLDDLKERK